MRLRLEDAIGDKILRVDVRVGSQEGVKLGVGVRPGKFWTRGVGSYYLIIEVCSCLLTTRCYQHRRHVSALVCQDDPGHLGPSGGGAALWHFGAFVRCPGRKGGLGVGNRLVGSAEDLFGLVRHQHRGWDH